MILINFIIVSGTYVQRFIPSICVCLFANFSHEAMSKLMSIVSYIIQSYDILEYMPTFMYSVTTINISE